MHQHLKGGGRGGIRMCLPVHCLSARSDRQPYCHINATSSEEPPSRTPTVSFLASKGVVGKGVMQQTRFSGGSWMTDFQEMQKDPT